MRPIFDGDECCTEFRSVDPQPCKCLERETVPMDKLVTVQIDLPINGDTDQFESCLAVAFSKYNASGNEDAANSLAMLIEIVHTAPRSAP